MRQTLVGVFDRHADAQRAANLLKERGIPPDSVFVTEAGELEESPPAQSSDATRHEGGVLASVKNFFQDLFSDDSNDEVRAYSEAVRRGGTLVKVEVEDDSVSETARDALQSAGAVDIDERMSSWQQGATETPAAPAAPLQKKSTAAGRKPRQEEVIPVVREEIQVGKRSVRSGGVRVYSRTVSEPVHESVALREERAVVERRPVDRAVGASDQDAMKERTVEVTESVERPVVQKTARVVEEVVVGKEVRQVQADVEDTVRRTEVEVESLGGDASDADTGAFRSDFESKYASAGGRFEDYEPAYRYGGTARKDPRHADRSWSDVEGDVQRDWTATHPDSRWERMKDAVRHGWERTKR